MPIAVLCQLQSRDMRLPDRPAGLSLSLQPALGLLICARAEVHVVQSTLQLRGLILDGLLLLVCSRCCLLWCRDYASCLKRLAGTDLVCSMILICSFLEGPWRSAGDTYFPEELAGTVSALFYCRLPPPLLAPGECMAEISAACFALFLQANKACPPHQPDGRLLIRVLDDVA